MMAEAGTAICLMPDQVNAQAIAAALRAVMGSPDYRRRAGQVAEDMLAMANPSQVADTLATRFANQP